MIINYILKRNIYISNIQTYLGYSYIKYNPLNKFRYKIINSSVYEILKDRKMKLPKNYETQYETRDFNKRDRD